jgi:Plasmid pRiA4b ORF-3-like protein
MTEKQTLIFRAALPRRPSVYRDIELDSKTTLHDLAEAIVASFDFNFDHAFGFYTGLKGAQICKTFPKYELFADLGDAEPRVLGVMKIRAWQAFPEVGHTMLFLFDYGDEWHFKITLRAVGEKTAKTRYPRIIASVGKSPEQYPDPDEDFDDEPETTDEKA